MRVLVFGDSITQGYWDTDGGWVDRVRKHYDELQVTDLQGRDEPSFFNLGISADTSTDVLARITPEIKARTRPHHKPPVIIIQIGVNDSCLREGRPYVSPDEYKRNLTAVIGQVKVLGAKLIFVGSSGCDDTKTNPVAWDTKFHYSSERIRAYEADMKLVAQEHDIPFIPVFEQFIAKFKQDMSILPDGLHPNNAGHQIIAEIVLPRLQELLLV